MQTPPSLPSETQDVIIVGGRPAGATLAMRLAREGLKVLVIERATFPSAPPVSVPFLMNNSMALLDELDLPEPEYAGDAPKLRSFVVEIRDHLKAPLTITRVGERDYVYVIDRGRFDTCLWRALDRHPTITKLEGVAFKDVVKDESGRVTGVKLEGDHVLNASCVIGADGRYSAVARAVGAEITEERADVETSLLYAYWTGWEPYEGDPAKVQIHGTGDGFSYIVMPTTGGRAAFVYQGRADRYNPEGAPAEAYYLEGLRRTPAIGRRMSSAKMVSKVIGIKKIGNLYRRASGPGWALVGDAFHQKDSIDAQGLYDALLESKLLAAELIAYKRGSKSWRDAISDYERQAISATRPMFLATMDRLKREIYTDVPPFVAKTVLRWMMTDPEYIRRFSQMLSRQLAPEDFAPRRSSSPRSAEGSPPTSAASSPAESRAQRRSLIDLPRVQRRAGKTPRHLQDDGGAKKDRKARCPPPALVASAPPAAPPKSRARPKASARAGGSPPGPSTFFLAHPGPATYLTTRLNDAARSRRPSRASRHRSIHCHAHGSARPLSNSP